MLQKSRWLTRRTVLQLAGLFIVAVITRIVLGFTLPAYPIDKTRETILIGFPICVVVITGSLLWGGFRAAVFSTVVVVFAILATLWYSGLTEAIEWERLHARDLND